MTMKTLATSSLLLLLGGCACSSGVVHCWMPRISSVPVLSQTTTRPTFRLAAITEEHVVEESSITKPTIGSNEQPLQASSSFNRSNKKKKRRVAVLVCPAQFCVPNDYTILLENLEHHFHANSNNDEEEEEKIINISTSSRTTPLSRTDWIQVAKQLPTKEFFQSNLSVPTTLDWYFARIEQGLADIFAHESSSKDDDDDDWSLCIIGHSIGGWVARAYLGGMSRSSTAVHRMALEKCSSLITLGTPHLSSPLSSNKKSDSNDNADNNNNNMARLLDQTRGLLRSIAEHSNCSPQALLDNHGIATTCVCGQGLEANLWTVNPEELLALGSYLPLLGRLSTKQDDSSDSSGTSKNIVGDGIVPIQVAFLDAPARQVLLDTCPRTNQAVRHAHVIPTPWNLWDGTAPSIALNEDEYPSYVSQSIVGQWARYIQ